MMETAQNDRPPLQEVVAARREEQEIRRNSYLLVINGGMVMMSYTFISADLVMPAFVQTLTTSSILVGMAGALMRMGWAWPQVFISRIIEPKPRKMPLLIWAGMARSVMWVLVGVMTIFFGGLDPAIFLTLFMIVYAVGTSLMGVMSVPWMDLMGKAIPATHRAKIFALRRFAGGGMSMVAGVLIAYILSEQSGLTFPNNYAVLFMLSGGGTALAVLTFGLIHEPIEKNTRPRLPLKEYLLSGLKLMREDANFRRLCMVQFLWAFSMMAGPFYVPYAISGLGIGVAYIGYYVISMQFSSVFSNVAWAWVGRYRGNQALFLYGTCLLALSILVPMCIVYVPDRVIWIWGTEINQRVVVYAFTFIFSGAAQSGMYSGRMTYVLDIAPADRRPTYTSFMNMFMFPQGLLPMLAGVLVAWISYQN
ncbi:MAG: MFS transporter, partial [Candidatus Latescibacteria bacterium]|nr:MFS transporter [Candidatus Latescibacterota bacterium]